MFRNLPRRVGITFFVVLSLLFTQLALANYVCTSAEAEDSAVMEMAPGQPCEGMAGNTELPALCHQHCTNAAQSFEPIKAPVISLPAVVQVLMVPLLLESARQQGVAFPQGQEAQPPPTPVFLSTLRLRV